MYVIHQVFCEDRTQEKLMKSFIPSTCGCVHLQHTILCTRSIIIDVRLYMKVVTSPACTHTHSQTYTQTAGSGLSGDQNLVSYPLYNSLIL